MGAPNTAYQDILLNVDVDLQIAKELTEYLSAFGGIEGLFYLDKLVYIDNGTIKGFIGAVRIGGANEPMHADARKSTVIIEDDEGNEYVLLLDAGLNTLGMAMFNSLIDDIFSEFEVNIDYKSAYYLYSTDFGFAYRWRNDANTGWLGWNYVSLSYMGQIDANDTLNTNVPVPIKRPQNEIVLAQIKAYYENDEGTYEESNITTLYPKLKPILLQLNVWTGSPTTYYINDDEIIAGGSLSTLTGLWANNDMSGGRYTTSMQLWIDDRYYYTYGYDTVNDIWCFLSLTDTEIPGPTFAQFDYVFYKSNTSLTIDDINDEMMASPTGPGWVTGSIYNPLPPDPNSDKWYINETFTILANGWYVQGTFVVGARRALKIISGIVVEDYNNE